MNPRAVHAVLDAFPMRGGNEHRVALVPQEGRVMKVADVQAPATESLFDYLTDLILSNHDFDDDQVRLEVIERRGSCFEEIRGEGAGPDDDGVEVNGQRD